jgi:hypothetical protein
MAVRSEWRLGERPISDMIHLLKAHGVKVFSLVEECRELDAFRFGAGKCLTFPRYYKVSGAKSYGCRS